MPKYLPEVDFHTNVLNNRILAVYFTITKMQNMSLELLGGFCIFAIIRYAANGLGNSMFVSRTTSGQYSSTILARFYYKPTAKH